MKGWKTWASGLLAVAWGPIGFKMGLHGADVAVGFVSAGFGVMGIGHKIEKHHVKKKDIRRESH